MVRGKEIHPVSIGTGERLLFGRAPHGEHQPGRSAIRLPDCAPHVSAVLAELVVGAEMAQLRWLGTNEGRLSSLLHAPGGARRVTLVRDLTAMLDEGKNELLVLSGRRIKGLFADLELSIVVSGIAPVTGSEPVVPRGLTAPKPHVRDNQLVAGGKEWFVALALAEPWLAGQDDFPFPPTNRRIYERILYWRGDAWNLVKSQRVDDVIRVVSRIAFGELEDPYTEARAGRIQNPRFAVGKRVAEYRIVTSADLDQAEQRARARQQGAGPAQRGHSAD
ncbi:hypothetical protein BLA60_08655 [Actinophytocola xinjiangensis]|uniref:Uncharacterized protein n=1 Tax=Actinophytocola xinjiangensis TaxID=485602 RepID=A0A7Z0WPJ5_9PSEU|nr:hypothetical protein BLA60_08655 [Actinophytocola xinjiangensis]